MDELSAPDRARRFSRFWTREVGLLHEGLLETSHSLTEARVLYELGQVDETTAAELVRVLALDAGQLSRVLTAMGTIEELLGDGRDPALVLRAPLPGDYGWVVQRHGALYAREYGFDATFEALVAQIVATYVASHDPARERAWIAALDGDPVGSVFCVDAGDGVAKLRLLIVDPAARGRRVGTLLVEECIRFARAIGYRELVLWTQQQLTGARRIYQRAGFELVEAEPESMQFGTMQSSEIWMLAL